jgi:hypothetical protein
MTAGEDEPGIVNPCMIRGMRAGGTSVARGV